MCVSQAEREQRPDSGLCSFEKTPKSAESSISNAGPPSQSIRERDHNKTRRVVRMLSLSSRRQPGGPAAPVWTVVCCIVLAACVSPSSEWLLMPQCGALQPQPHSAASSAVVALLSHTASLQLCECIPLRCSRSAQRVALCGVWRTQRCVFPT